MEEQWFDLPRKCVAGDGYRQVMTSAWSGIAHALGSLAFEYPERRKRHGVLTAERGLPPFLRERCEMWNTNLRIRIHARSVVRRVVTADSGEMSFARHFDQSRIERERADFIGSAPNEIAYLEACPDLWRANNWAPVGAESWRVDPLLNVRGLDGDRFNSTSYSRYPGKRLQAAAAAPRQRPAAQPA